MMHETSDVETKRFEIYRRMLALGLSLERHAIVTKPQNSSIFVMPIKEAKDEALKQSIIQRYERIFAEAF